MGEETDWYETLKDIEPYTVGYIISYGDTRHGSVSAFSIYYRNYSRRQSTIVWAKDELSAFIEATQHLQDTKNKWHRQNKKEQTNERS